MNPPIIAKHIGANGCNKNVFYVNKGNPGASFKTKDPVFCSNCGKRIELYTTNKPSFYDN